MNNRNRGFASKQTIQSIQSIQSEGYSFALSPFFVSLPLCIDPDPLELRYVGDVGLYVGDVGE